MKNSIHAIGFTGNATAFRIALYGTALTLIWIGVFKFTPTEAKGIQELLDHSPFMSWMYRLGSIQQVSNFIGAIEIVTGVTLLCFPYFPKLSLAGGLLASMTFILTISFMFTTPGMFGIVDGLFVPTSAQFFIKDIPMLATAIAVTVKSKDLLTKAMNK